MGGACVINMKVIYEASGPEGEITTRIRRFASPIDQISTYTKLMTELKEFYRGMNIERCCITWKDSDGDRVLINNDREVMAALNATHKNDVLVLYISDI